MRKTKTPVIGLQVWVPRNLSDRKAYLAREIVPYFKGFRIVMPCGKVYFFLEPYSIPLIDVNCECRNPYHWLVVWREHDEHE